MRRAALAERAGLATWRTVRPAPSKVGLFMFCIMSPGISSPLSPVSPTFLEQNLIPGDPELLSHIFDPPPPPVSQPAFPIRLPSLRH